MTVVLDGSGIVTTGVINSGTAVSTATGATFYDFTGIPAGVKRITVMFNGVSTNGLSNIIVQIGSGSVETTSYSGSCSSIAPASVVSVANLGSGFSLGSGFAATHVRSGSIILSTVGSNIWTCMGVIGQSDATQMNFVGGVKQTSGTIDRLRLTTANGTDTFDAGSVNVFWE